MYRFDFNIFDNSPKRQTVPDGETAEALKLLSAGISRRLFIAAIFIALLVLITQSVVITRPDQYAVIRQFERVTVKIFVHCLQEDSA